MTNAHELAERWFDNLTDKYIGSSPPAETVNSLALLIHQVAERTRKECIEAYYDCPIDKDVDLAIGDARWEDEEV